MSYLNRISGFVSTINLRELPQYIPTSVRNLNWKVGGIVAGAISALVIVALLYRRSTQPGISLNKKKVTPQPTPSVSPKLPEILPQPTSSATVPSTSKATPPPLKSIKNAEPTNLGFSNEQLMEKALLPKPLVGGFQEWSFYELCSHIINAIRNEIIIDKKTVIDFNSINHLEIFDYLNFGLLPDQTFETAGPEGRRSIWIYRTLQALQDNNYIRSFTIEFKNIHIEAK